MLYVASYNRSCCCRYCYTCELNANVKIRHQMRQYHFFIFSFLVFFLYNFIPFHSATQSLSIDTEVIIFRALQRVQSFFVEWTIAKHFFISHAIKSISQLTHQCIHEFILCWKCQQFSRNNAAKWNNLRVTMFSFIFRRILNVKFRNWHAEGLLQSLWMLIGSKIALLPIVVSFWRIFFRVFSWLVMMWWECC